ncbi:serine/threonine protein kinase [Nocardia sp. NPDC058658]|uniref:serine/threonine protein kinase n=1 Tax=Nocardia sp. NPDC058658 TaxID=3346580 RepID=UPI00366107B3
MLLDREGFRVGVENAASFAGYDIESVLGQGGMGTVYLARHPRLPRLVALKLLNREVSADPEIRRRFEQEGDVVARLDHPGIVGIYDRGTSDGHLWIAMQYIQGSDVSKLDPRSITADHALRIISDTAAALDHAHAHGVLHRDVKPANILLAQPEAGRPERAVLTDFGIARLLDSATQLTATGTFTATLAYASPEQLSAEVVDHRADQYSLACTLFTLLAGQTPYASSNPGQVVASHLSQPVPRLKGFRSDLPPALDDVFARAMAKNRDERFGSCGEFAAVVGEVLRGGALAVAPSRVAPTVFNQEPGVGVGRPGIPGPHRGSSTPTPLQPVAPPRRKSRKPRVFAGMGLTMVAVVALVYTQRDALEIAINGWNEQFQEIADAFPGMLPASNGGDGWIGTKCTSGTYLGGRMLGIRCDNKSTGISYVFRKYATEAEATSQVFSSISDRSGDKTVSHPGLPTPLSISMRRWDGLASSSDLYTRFPGDSQRSKFVFVLTWANHSAEETLQQWWPHAPLGQG